MSRVLGAVMVAALSSAAPAALAYPDAQVEAATRVPDFRWLLAQPTWPHPCCAPVPPPIFPHPCCRRPIGPPIGWRPPFVGPPVLNRVVVDCAGWRPHAIERALSVLRPGGTLILRTHGGACREAIYITKSVQIIGEGGSDLFYPPRASFPLTKAVLVAPPGLPCISVAPGVRAVSIRGLVMNAPAAQGAACIQARDADVELTDNIIRYEGLGSPINIEGGTVRLKNIGIGANTPAPAVISEGSDVSFEDLRIATARFGLLVEPGPGESQLIRVFARALDDGTGDEAHPTTGLMVRGGSDHGRVKVTDAVLVGFSTGARFDHDVQAELRYGRIGFSRVGVLTDGDVGVKGVTIGASEVGVYVRAGRAAIINNRIYGVRYAAIYADRGAQVWAAGNSVYPGPDCGFLRDPTYNATGQVCRPWNELPDYLREPTPYVGRFQDGWSEWRYDWGYDWQSDAWRTGPGFYDDRVWDARPPVFRGDMGYRYLPPPTMTPPNFGTRTAPQSPTEDTDPYKQP